MCLDFFHMYHDNLHFPYQVDITRDDEELGEKGQRYTLCVSNNGASFFDDPLVAHMLVFSSGSLMRSLIFTGSQQDFSRRREPINQVTTARALAQGFGIKKWSTSWHSFTSRPELNGKIVSCCKRLCQFRYFNMSPL